MRRWMAPAIPAAFAIVVTLLPAGGALAGGAAVEVAAGDQFACARTDAGEVWCWGDGSNGALGDGSMDVSSTPVRVALLEPAVAIDAGFDRACAVVESGSTWCWGGSPLGDGTDGESAVPVLVTGIPTAADVSVGRADTCVRLADSGASCWGITIVPSDAELAEAAYSPVRVDGLDSSRSLATGLMNACAIGDDDRVRCWGAYGHVPGEGPFDRLASDTPVEPYPLPAARQVTSQKDSLTDCVLGTDGSVSCWGELLRPCGESIHYSDAPEAIRVSGVEQLVAGACSTCAILVDGSLSCWGNNLAVLRWLWPGDLPKTWNEPQVVAGLPPVVDAAIGSLFGCAVLEGGRVACWGRDDYGQLGDGQPPSFDSLSPRLVALPG